MLKRLDDAIAEGDEILGVIRGIGLSNDGSAGGFLSPSVDGQIRAMEAAYDMAGLAPNDISLLECHATGTPVGDAIEIESAAHVFHGATEIPIGSLKSNLGHLITAAGAAGLIKVLAALRTGILPPSRPVATPLAALAESPGCYVGIIGCIAGAWLLWRHAGPVTRTCNRPVHAGRCHWWLVFRPRGY